MMRRISIALIVLAACRLSLGQNLLLNPSFQDPAIARLKIKPTVSDADWVALDTGDTNHIYEFDTDGAYDPLHIQVYLGSDNSTENAAKRLRDAVNADASAIATATARNPNDGSGNYEVYFAWKGYGGQGKVNSSNKDGSGTRLEIDNFNEKCRRSTVTVLDWQGSNGLRDDSVFGSFPCPAGCQFASLTGSGTTPKMIYQTVSTLDPSKNYLLTGVWTLGDYPDPATFSAELHDGTDTTGIPLAQATVTLSVVPGGITYRWLPFSVGAQPTGNTMTVVFKVADTTGNNYGMHVDNVSLVESTCTPPTIASFAPGTVLTAHNYDDLVMISGSGFVPGQTSVRFRRDDYWVDPANELVATDVKVDGSGTSLTCDLSIPSGATVGYYSAIVQVTGCGAGTLGNTYGDALNVVKGGPFANGSFELPDPMYPPPYYNACPISPQGAGAPSSWEAAESNGFGWMAKLFRDNLNPGLGFLEFLPHCPPPDGWHYAGAWSNAGASGSPHDFIYQTFEVTANQRYTFSGYFAGSGHNNVEMEMRDGPNTALLLAKTTIHRGGGNYDWLFNAVSATPTTSLLTVGWHMYLEGDGPHATFADNVQVAVCSGAITLTGISPASAVNSGSLPIILTGTGFLTSPTPQVIFSKADTVLNAVVTGTAATEISCTLDLTGAPSGKYDVLVVQGGCIARLSEAVPAIPLFQLIAQDFLNGSFESPTTAQNCGGDTAGLPTGWNRSDDLHRNGSVHVPTCPPLPDGLHYGSMSTGGGQVEQAWQTLAVTPGWTYRLSGQFAGGGSNTVSLKLLDGDEGGQLIAQTQVHAGADPYPWTPFEVSGLALSSVMTVVWEMSDTADISAAHADALVFEVTSRCNTYWADADDDGDVDQADFAVFQLCYTGDVPPVPADPSYCQCFNHVRDDVVNTADLVEFESCASGPGITPKAACQN